MSEEAQAPQTEEELTVEIDGNRLKFSELSEDAQALIQLHQEWATVAEAKVAEATREANMATSAVKHLANQIVAQVRNDIEKAGAAQAEAEQPDS